ncbi:putative g3bp-like protein [Phtheirospermum japonicum]|uniref:Putative g3bp-like protein n=1 Tax=Phtheirospermum japonicum TaxID=374723 RepID=A0A830DGV6_9LAMI|nr:putative g3bp-like protein [Phtheirospermum japonicum]
MATATSEAVAVAAQHPVSAQVVGNAFVQQYYHILHHSPGLVHRFYQDISMLGRPEEDGSMSITTTMEAINEKIVSLNYGSLRAEIKSVDSQGSFSGGVLVLVTGYLTGEDNIVNNFSQSFFLAPQDRGYFVLNDMFRYVVNPSLVTVNPTSVIDDVVPPAAEPVAVPVQDNHVSEESTPSAEEAIAGEVYNPPENGDVPIAEEDEEEIPIAEVVDEVQVDNNTELVVESSAKGNEVPKKSFAWIVRHLNESSGSFSPPPPAPRKVAPKSMEQVSSTVVPTPDGPVSSSDSVDNEHNQEGEADGYSIYIKGLPMNATEALLEEVFKKFGTIKKDGIQVRSNKQQVFCFGFVEFEEATSVQKAIEASPVAISGRQAFIEEKRSTRNNRARFQSGRGSGFRNDGVRGGRGNYGGGRGYNNKADFNNRGDFGNRAGNRGVPSNRDDYHKSENSMSNGGPRVNRAGGMANGGSKNMAPRVSATA